MYVPITLDNNELARKSELARHFIEHGSSRVISIARSYRDRPQSATREWISLMEEDLATDLAGPDDLLTIRQQAIEHAMSSCDEHLIEAILDLDSAYLETVFWPDVNELDYV